ncbi:MAG: polysaccharide deacetylase family protein [Solirubrobacterales bacterium]
MSGAGNSGFTSHSDSRWLWLVGFFGLLALITALLILLSGPPSVIAAGNDLREVKISQKGKLLVIRVDSADRFAISQLVRQPDFDRPLSRYLCLELRRKGESRISRICIGGQQDYRSTAGFARVDPDGQALKPRNLPVTVKGSSSSGLAISLAPGSANLVPGRYAWRVRFSNGDCIDQPLSCRSAVPPTGLSPYRLRPIQVVGCTGGDGQVVTRGPRGKKRVALTFDDGPSGYTPDVLRILKKKKARATFFMVGDLVAGDPAAARRVLAAGHEIANHSSDHALLPSYSNLKRASRQIREATGFKPCLFRPPYGAIDSSLKQNVRDLDMKSVLWDIDTVDWSSPGSGSIRSRASSAGSGSIVLMHDGGGPRSQTLDALPGAIDSLRSRGYKLVTVTELLGNRFIYRPR